MPRPLLSPVECHGVLVEVQKNAHVISFLEKVVLASDRVEESAPSTELLGGAAGKSPGPTANGTRLDADYPVRPATRVGRRQGKGRGEGGREKK